MKLQAAMYLLSEDTLCHIDAQCCSSSISSLKMPQSQLITEASVQQQPYAMAAVRQWQQAPVTSAELVQGVALSVEHILLRPVERSTVHDVRVRDESVHYTGCHSAYSKHARCEHLPALQQCMHVLTISYLAVGNASPA
jgi:hypothetical protein